MNQKILVLAAFFMISLPHKSYTQNLFPDENVVQKWEYVTWYFWGGRCETRIIKTGQKVEKCNDNYIEVLDCDANENNCYISGYYRLQGDSVLIRTNYVYYNGRMDTVVCAEGEGLMYDFNTVKNDTVICQINSTWPSTYTKFWEKDKQMVNYEGIERQTTRLHYIPHPNAPFLYYEMKWINGIGSTIHPFYSLSCIGDHCEHEQQLTKVYRNEELIYQDTTLKFLFPCNTWVSSTENTNKVQPKISLVPNPADNYITIVNEHAEQNFIQLKLYDTQGKNLKSIDDYKYGNQINIEDLSNGLYIIQLFDGTHTQTIKMVK